MMNFNRKRGQGAMEYIILLAGIMLVVILVVVLLRGSLLGQANHQISSASNTYGALISVPTITGLIFLVHFDSSLATYDGENSNSSGSPTFESGRFGEGVTIDNVSAVNDNVTYLGPGNLNVNTSTISFWVKPKWPGSAASNNVLFDTQSVAGDLVTASNRISINHTSAGFLDFTLFNSTGTGTSLTFNISSWAANSIHHVLVSWNVTASTREMRVDGVLVNSSTSSFGPFGGIPARIYVGQQFGGQSSHANATLDELVIYNRPLSGEEAQILGATSAPVPV